LKSGLLGILRGGLQGFAQTGSFAGALGGAISGGVGGAVHPQWDEELKRVAAVYQQRGKVAQALEIEKELGQLDEMDARAQAARAKGSPDAQVIKSRSQALGEAARRLRLMGGVYMPGKDTALDAIVGQYGLSPKQKGAGGLNAQALKVVDGNLTYTTMVDGQPTPVVLWSAGMSKSDRERNAIALAGVNAQRARNGEVPLMLSEDLQGSPDTTNPTDGTTEQTPQAQAPTTYTGPRGPGAAPPVSNPSTAPAPAVGSSVLTPVPGAKPTAPLGGRYGSSGRRSGRASSSSRSDSIGDSLEARDAARYTQEAANARAQAQSARARGEDDVAQSWETAAQTADENARKVGRRRGAAQKNTPAPKKGDPLGILD
jgi:hypothetical protein